MLRRIHNRAPHVRSANKTRRHAAGKDDIKMKKILAAILAMLMFLPGCGREQAQKPDGQIDNSYAGEVTDTEPDETDAAEELRELMPVTDEETVAGDRAVATGLLDSFKALDYEGAMAWVREEDRQLMDLESARTNAAYSALLPRMTYELGDSLTDGENRYIRVSVTAPSMKDVYGQVFIRMNDALMNGEISSEEETAAFNNAAIADVVENGDVKVNTMDVDIPLEIDGDGNLRACLTAELLNAMLGDIQNAAAAINEAVDEGMDQYNSAKAAGEFD